MQQEKDTPRSHPHDELYQMFSNLSKKWDPYPNRLVAYAHIRMKTEANVIVEMSADVREYVLRFVCSYQFPTNIGVREQEFLEFVPKYFRLEELFEINKKQLNLLDELVLDSESLDAVNVKKTFADIEAKTQSMIATFVSSIGALYHVREDHDTDFEPVAKLAYVIKGSA